LVEKKIFSFLFFLRLFGSEGYLSDGHYADDRCTGGSDAQVFTNFAFTHTHTKGEKRKKGDVKFDPSIHRTIFSVVKKGADDLKIK
jgi:hypothetical protein